MVDTSRAKDQVANTKITTVYQYLDQRRDEIARALPSHVTPDRLIQVMTMMIKGSPELAGCTQASLVGAVVQSVQLGLQVGNIGHCYFIPFNNKQKDGSVRREIQFMLGYKGIIELVNRSGKAVILSTEVVYENDRFEYEQGLNPVLKHIPTDGERGKITHVYCIAKNMLADEKTFIVLTKADIDKVRASSKAGSSSYSPWTNWYSEMAKKTAVRRISKLLPLSVEVQHQVSADETVKTRIKPDMAIMPDETNWNETVDGDVIPSENAEDAPDSTQGVGVEGKDKETTEGDFEPSSSKSEPDVLRSDIIEMCRAMERSLLSFTKSENFAGTDDPATLKDTVSEGKKKSQLSVQHSIIKKEYNTWLENKEIDLDKE